MSTLHPERVIAVYYRSGSAFVWTNRPAMYPPVAIPATSYAIPRMCSTGVKEKGLTRILLTTYGVYRSKGAPAGFAPDPRTGHECGDSRYFAIPFLDACLAMRLPDKSSNGQTLKLVDMSRAWLASLGGDTAVPAADYKGKSEESMWLPNEAVAKAWMEYVKTGAVGDTTPPPAPFDVRVTEAGDQGAEISWDAEADFESGIGGFIVMRDGKEFAQVPEKPVGKFGRPLFQSMTYHDTPDQPMPKMRFVDASAKAGEKHAYAVITVNSVGLKSEPALATAAQQPLPWKREISLREAAQTTLVQGPLNPTDPGRSAMSINNLKMHTVMWGPPNRITISINKNNVWDRRLHEFQAPTLQEITEGAFSPANKDYIGVKEIDSVTFDPPDFVELTPLADKLANRADPLSASVVARLDDKSKALLAAFEADRTNYRLGRELLTNLTAGFNLAISGPPLYDARLFANIRLRPDTESLRQRNPQGSELRRLNRLLLEDVYPEISKRPGNSLRPLDLGWLSKEGGSVDPYRYPMRYAFPCLKPVGQIILGIDPLEGATAPRISQSCANGVTSLQVTKGDAKADLQYVLEMGKDVYAIRGNLSGIDTPVWLRLYRHRDTAHLDYMTPDGKYTKPAAEKDKAFNGPIEPPTSGQDGRYFWIRQKMPAEKTFPQGFEYVLMGVIKGQGEIKIEAVTNQLHLGTPPPNPPMPWDWFGAPRPSIAEAPGDAATATFKAGADGKLEAFVTVVTTMDGPDLVAEARKRLADAEKAGFDGAVQENTTWWNAFYDKRENGRIFQGSSGTACTENIRALYQQSWTDSHGGGTKTDMRLYECSASYALPERDFQDFDSMPCYNEVFPTSRYVRNWGDSEDMWLQIVQHWMPGAQQNARDRFNLPGMCITHGYCPPVKPDKYVHSTITLELCLGTMAEILLPAWDEWDYGGDLNFLRAQCYPAMKEMARFYAAYAKKGSDNYYHIIPSMQEEYWGIYPEFSRNKDVISSLCMFRWALTRAADAAELLGVDAELRQQWREVAAQLAPNPTWKKSFGTVFSAMPDVEPRSDPRDHPFIAVTYPTILADEINLDSPQELKDLMARTAQNAPVRNSAGTLLLLGMPSNSAGGRRGEGGSTFGGGGGALDPEAMLNSRSGRIHVFPVVAPNAELAFHNFQARGGFLVSAARNAAGTYYLEIQARRDVPCKLMNPWPGKPVTVREVGKTEPVPVQIDRSNGECLLFAAIANPKYQVQPK
jgi:hypothetical protein